MGQKNRFSQLHLLLDGNAGPGFICLMNRLFAPEPMAGSALARIFHSLCHRHDHSSAGGSYAGDSQRICGLSPDVPASVLGPWIVCSLHAGYRVECETSGLESLNRETCGEQVKFSDSRSFDHLMVLFRGSTRLRSGRQSEALAAFKRLSILRSRSAKAAGWSEAAPRWR
jgi:hypothetical protein